MPLGRSVAPSLSLLVCLALPLACSNAKSSAGIDDNHDNVADDLGKTVDENDDGLGDGIDIDDDGTIDGPGVDTNHDGKVDALALDTDCDGLFDSLDTTGDGLPDWVTDIEPPRKNVKGCELPMLGGSGGSSGGSGGSSSSGGKAGSGGKGGGSSMAGSAGKGGGGNVTGELGKGAYQGTGSSTDRYAESDIFRDGVGYKFIANGWGSGWQSHDVSWNGTSFTVKALSGSQGQNYSPAGYPTMFCGLYSEPPKPSAGTCGLPAAISSLGSVKTGWRWKANGNNGQYNAAWDIWLGNGESLSAYLMVWLRDPPGQQPAGSATTAGASVPGLPGSWSIWTGDVMGHPIVNYVLGEGQDIGELEFDVMDVYADAKKRNFNLPGSHIIAVAVGFEVWNGPISNLVTEDFYVDVK